MGRAREKDSTADYRRLSMNGLRRGKLLTPGACFDWCWWRDGEKVAGICITVESRCGMRLRYQSRSQGSEPVQYDYPVSITWTPCHLGGERPWFRCPQCDSRVLNLYGGAMFACRHCMRLNYRSQQASKRDRATDRSWALRYSLGCDSGPFDYPAEYIRRPKGMHRKTFARRLEQLSRIEEKAVAEIDALLEVLR